MMSILKGEEFSWNTNDVSPTIVDIFHKNLKNGEISRESVALKQDGYEMTFGQLDALSSHLALMLQQEMKAIKNKNPDGDLAIGTCMKPSTKYICVVFAIWKLGGAYVPFDVTFPENRILRICNECQPSLIITDEEPIFKETFTCISKLNVKLYALSNMEFSTANMEREILSSRLLNSMIPSISSNKPKNDELICAILYTSGSTGAPKGVRLSHHCVLNRLYWEWNAYPFKRGLECGCWKTTMTFVDALPELLGPLLQGEPVAILQKATVADTTAFLQSVQDNNVSRIYTVPSFMKMIFQAMEYFGLPKGRQLLSSVKLWITDSEVLSYEMLTEFFEYFPEGLTTFVNFYGSTEILDVTHLKFDSKSAVERNVMEGQVPIGKPITNTILYIVDSELKPVRTGEQGQIVATGRNVAEGYVGKAGTETNFVSNPFSNETGYSRMYLTGDYGRIVKNKVGEDVILLDGRMEARVKVRGHRVDLHEIETTLRSLGGIKNVKVLCHNRDASDQEIVAFVVPKKSSTTHEDLLSQFRNNLRPIEMPTIEIMSELPLLINLKTDRGLLLQRYAQKKAKYHHCVTENEPIDWTNVANSACLGIETKLKAIVPILATTIGIPESVVVQNLQKSYFDIGGNSVNTITAVLSLAKAGWHITPVDFIKAGSIIQILMSTRMGDNDNAKQITMTHSRNSEFSQNWFIEKLEDQYKDDVIHICSKCFINHGDLEILVKPSYSDIVIMLQSVWNTLLNLDCSFVVRRKEDNQIIGVSLNLDENEAIYPRIESKPLEYAINLPTVLEGRGKLLAKLPKELGKLMNGYVAAVNNDMLSPAETIALMEFMDRHNIDVAKDHGFTGILTVNTSQLTKDISVGLLGFTVLEEFQTNQYVDADGSRPFAHAADDHTIICAYLPIQ